MLAVLLSLDKIHRVSISDYNRDQQMEEMLGTSASTIQHLRDEALIALHEEHLRRNDVHLAKVTRKELDWRGLHID